MSHGGRKFRRTYRSAAFRSEESNHGMSGRMSMNRDSFNPKGQKMEFSEKGSQRGGRSVGWKNREDKPPPELRGRAIGMWYKKKSLERRADPNYQPPERVAPSIPVELSEEKQLEIQCLLEKVSMPVPPCVRKAQGKKVLPVDKYSHVEESDFKRRFLKSITGSLTTNMNNGSYEKTLSGSSYLNKLYKHQLLQKQEMPQYRNMSEFRKKLPSYKWRDDILDLINNNQVVVLSGETGCGKTTQVPQFILDQEILAGRGSECRIICTQPRRISAISVAERVANERAEELGNSVGYHIRLERNLPRTTGCIIFCTNGMALQYMENDPALKKVSHIILDEIHERDTVSDFLIAILKDIVNFRTDLKVILMSATLNADKFSKYFENCPSINIPGLTFPVKEYYLEDVLQVLRFKIRPQDRRNNYGRRKKESDKQRADFLEPYFRNLRRTGKYSEGTINSLMCSESEDINLDLIYELILYICLREPMGAILVFLPGWDKISTLNNIMKSSGKFPPSRYLIIPLHSMMPTMTQKKIFNKPPQGVRKIVIATNIAETSITIDDIVYVIDSGKIKMKNYDIENNLSTLQEEWVSIANAKQRKGRAGRVQEGICYHLFTRGREMLLNSYQLPEMLRTRLEEVILQAKVLQVGLVEPFLNKVLDSPDPRAVQISLKLLKSMNALDDDERLTPLGYHLAHLPMDPQAGKMILFAAMFGCLDPISSIAASLSFKDAFVIPLGREKEVDKRKLELSQGNKSDHLLMAQVMDNWEQAEEENRGHEFTKYYFLSRHTLELLSDMKNQFSKYLYEMKFLPTSDVKNYDSNIHSYNIGLIKAILCAGLYPNVAVLMKMKGPKKTGNMALTIRTPEGENVKLHPKSVNEKMVDFESRLLVYHLKLKSTAIYLHDTSLVFPLSLIFFCHNYKLEEEDNRILIIVNNLVRFSLTRKTAQLIQELRAWLDWLLEYRVSHPGVTNWKSTSDEGYILRAIIELISTEHNMYCQDDREDCSDDYDSD